MANTFYLEENHPFPNNALPVILYPNSLTTTLGTDYASSDIIHLFEKHNYSNAWTNGIHSFHHFHATVHEVLACFSGEASVQLGGPNGKIVTFSKGDALLLPAGTSHKKVSATDDFKIVGAYPNGEEFDMEKGDRERYEELIAIISEVPIPALDSIEGENGAVHQYWT
jgi:uncharacterized protein YjlB